jgi:hypothetical protein
MNRPYNLQLGRKLRNFLPLIILVFLVSTRPVEQNVSSIIESGSRIQVLLKEFHFALFGVSCPIKRNTDDRHFGCFESGKFFEYNALYRLLKSVYWFKLY